MAIEPGEFSPMLAPTGPLNVEGPPPTATAPGEAVGPLGLQRYYWHQ